MPRPRNTLREDLNSLVDPPKRANQSLPPREPRAPIPARQGRGVNAAGVADSVAVSGTVTSADGMFVIEYDYHLHGA